MCFRIDIDHKDPLVATEDIICYKTVFEMDDDFVMSVHKRFIYTFETLYRLGKNISVKDSVNGSFISEGFHSYVTLATADKSLFDLYGGIPGEVTVECCIPTGSTYYYSKEYDEYVSDSIIIRK